MHKTSNKKRNPKLMPNSYMTKTIITILAMATAITFPATVLAQQLYSKTPTINSSSAISQTKTESSVKETRKTTVNAVYKDSSSDFTIDANGVLIKYNGTESEVTIPNGVTEIGENAFSGRNDITSVTLSNSVTSIDDYAFSRLKNLSFVNLGSKLENIGEYAFDSCSSLKQIAFPDSLKTIQEAAFNDAGLTSVYIPKNITQIADDVFDGNGYALTQIDVDPANLDYSSLDGVLFNKNQTDLIQYPASKAGATYIIPSSVVSISYSAFWGSKNLTSVTIPNSVTNIGDTAFWGSENLINITIPSSVSNIGAWAFEDTPWLNNQTGDYVVVNRILIDYKGPDGAVTIPAGITAIGGAAFADRGNITSVTIPTGITSIGDYAFRDTNLSSVSIPSGVKSIGNYAFADCLSLTSVTIPSSVTSIDENAFYMNPALGNVSNITFIVDSGSYAEIYAKDYGLKYTLSGNSTPSSSSSSPSSSSATSNSSSSSSSSSAPSSSSNSSSSSSVPGSSSAPLDPAAPPSKTIGDSTAPSTPVSLSEFQSLAPDQNVDVQVSNASINFPAQCLSTLFSENSVTNVTFTTAQVPDLTLPNGSTALAGLTLGMVDTNGNALSVDNFGSFVQVTWTIPTAEAATINPTVARLYHVADNGQVDEVPAQFTRNTNGTITVVFLTTHFSSYAVTNTAYANAASSSNLSASATSSASSSSITSNPRTGDQTPFAPIMALMGLAASTVLVITRRKRSKSVK